MSLKINGRNIQSLPLRFRGAVGFEYAETNKGSQRNIYAGEGLTDKSSGNPAGHLYPSAWIWPQKPGSITAFKSISGEASTTFAGAMGVNGLSTIAGTSDLAAIGQLIVSGIANLSGSGALNGNIVAALAAAANLAGSGDVAGSITALGNILSSLSGSGQATLTPYATGTLAADITPFTELSPQSLAAQVLDNEDIESNYSLREAIRVILSMSAGKLSGATGSTVEIRDVNDLVTRITATVDGNGNRTAVTINKD